MADHDCIPPLPFLGDGEIISSKLRHGKKILLFADRTGNAIATQESKIWRIYQLLDPSALGQIGYYTRGVDTSEFKPWAVLDGATGIGVPSDALKLYYFLSWNSSPGDEIYMCGFSRGSLTNRLRIALSCMLGVG